MKTSRTVYRYRSNLQMRDEPLITELNRLAGLHPGYGFWKMYQRLRLDGFIWNHKRIHRIYKKLNLNIRRKHKRRLPNRLCAQTQAPLMPNQIWSMDFMHDVLYNGRKVKILNIIDEFNRQALSMIIDTSITAERVVEILTRLIELYGIPMILRTDNGPEFISHLLLDWCHRNRIQHQFIQPGKPTQNCYIERFNGTYRKEILDAYVFYSMQELREITEKWKNEYNTYRPHDSLGGITPERFLLNYGKLATQQANAEFTTIQQNNNNKNLIKLAEWY